MIKMIANTRQIGYVLIGMIFGYVLANSIQGAFFGGLIGFILSFVRRFF